MAAKLALGYTLDELSNQITKSTSALFEPTLDYVIVKIPRWNFDKFEGSDRTLGLQMKAVGEVMGIGRSFQEALHKATQSLEIKRNGLGADGKGYTDKDTIISKLTNASWDRVFVIYDAIQAGISLDRIYDITKIDMWFLKQYEELYQLEKEISIHKIDDIEYDILLEAKQKGFADRQIAFMLNCLESQVYKKREELVDRLMQNNIPNVFYYKYPIHLMKGFAYLRYKKGSFPVSENLSKTIISLPMHPYLSKEEINKIVQSLLK